MSTTDDRSSESLSEHRRTANPTIDGHDLESVPDTVIASVKAEDRPMEESHPTAPGALVLFTYPALLLIMILLALVLMAIFNYG